MLDRAQSEIGACFPADYREFMRWRNGGEPDPSFFVRRQRGERWVGWVQAFAPITSSRIDSLNLRGQQELLQRYADEAVPVPRGCIAVGYTGPGDSILLFTSGRRRGQVWLKVWDDVSSDPKIVAKPSDGLYKLAGSFNAFLKNLCTEEEAERRLARAQAPRPQKKRSRERRAPIR
ncbi:MAG: SMI1/KNR4 family protein [Fimbriimonadaceae bacterium]|nr:SMI1/KNR4 family protein [Fimbriimonadaceae bacterium]